MLEKDLERGLLDHLRALILELGKGFAFVGSQFPLDVGDQEYFLDLLFYHLRLRCFVVIDLKIDEFKPEFAGKMNFYLSAVDDLIRHRDDKPSIGIILCRRRDRVVVEYALRDMSKPMGVSEYLLSPSLPVQLEGDLPTADELAKEFPAFSLIRVRIEIERSLRSLLTTHGFDSDKPMGLTHLLKLLQQQGLAPDGTEEFLGVIRILNSAAHGAEVDERVAEEALLTANDFLKTLQNIP